MYKESKLNHMLFNTFLPVPDCVGFTWVVGTPVGETTPTKTVGNVDCNTCLTECQGFGEASYES